MNYKKLDFYLIPFSFLCFIISTYFLVSDQIVSRFSEQISIAEVISKTNTVKVRKGSSLFWGNSHSGDKLDENDKVYTHENSDAQISIINGPKLNIAENTLLSLSQFSKNKEIQVEKGFIVAELNNSTKDFKLNLGNEVIHLNSKNAKIQISKGKKSSSVSILEGKVEVKRSTKSVSLEKGHIITADVDNEIIINKSPVNLISPRQGDKIFLTATENKIKFDWDKITNGIIQISKEYTFRKILHSTKINSKSYTTKLTPGKYYWRINGQYSKSITQSFKVIPALSTHQNSPKHEEIIIYKDKAPTVHFSWIDPYFSEFELSLNGKNSIIKSKSIKIQSLNEGIYKWKIRPYNSPKSKWSKERVFTIKKPALPSAPKLILPLNNDEVIVFPNSKAVFRWSRNNTSDYFFELSKDVNFTKKIISKNVTKNIIRIEFKNSGKYFWRVRSIDSLGRNTKYTTPFSVDINLYKSNTIPEAGSKLVINKPSKKVEFKWKDLRTKNEKKIKYVFELSKDSSFTDTSISKQVNTNYLKTSIPDIGTYFWRTKIIVQGKKPYYGEPQQVTISPTPPPLAPKLKDSLQIELKINSILKVFRNLFTSIFNILIPSVSASEEATSAIIRWDEVPDTKEYYLEIYQDREMKSLIVSETLKINEYELINFKEGTYYWRIYTLDHWNRKSSFSNLSELTLTLPEKVFKISKSQLKAPKDNTLFNGSKKRIFFSWTKSPEAKKYQIVVSKDKDFNKIHLMRTVNKNNFSITLSKGIYFWKIISINKYERESVSSLGKFQIAPLIVKKKKRVKKKTIQLKKQLVSPPLPFKEKSNIYFRYDLLYSKMDQNYPLYTINAKDPIFTSFELGLNHLLKKGSLNLSVRRFSGEVYNGLSYGVLELSSSYQYFFTKKLSTGLGLSFNSYKSYFTQSNQVLEKDNTSINIPLFLIYRSIFKTNRNSLSLSYSIGSLSKLSIQNIFDLSFKKSKYFSFGVGYEEYKSTIDNSDLKISNMLASLKYNISY